MAQQRVSSSVRPVPSRQNGRVVISPELAYHRYQSLVSQGGNGAPGYQAEPARKQISDFDLRLQRFFGTFVLSPLFLISTLSVMLWFPEDLIRRITTPLSSIQFWELAGKRIFDIIMSIMGFIFCSMFFFVIPIIIKLDSRGPVFYRQIRVGMNNRKRDRRVINLHVEHDRRKGDRRQVNLYGRPFWVIKFRTMTQDAEQKSGAVWAQKNDPRVTMVGNILRFTHVDEIPQFYNVLCGEMSMVGPRPERPQFFPAIMDRVPNFPKRLQVKPGMTGIAQIVCGYDVTIEGVRNKLRYDLLYVRNSGLKADIVILLRTFWVIVRGKEVLD